MQACVHYNDSCPEKLKFLYVAITRARKNLWVVDRSETAEPMRVCIFAFENDALTARLPLLDILVLGKSGSDLHAT